MGVERLENVKTGGDFAFYQQVFWNHQNGIHYYTTLEDGGRSSLGTHVSLITLPLSFILLGAPLAYGMILLQTILCSSVAVLLYFIAEYRKIPPAWGFLIGVCWLASPFVQGALIFDFHIITLAPFFFFCGVLFFERDRLWWAGAFWFLTSIAQEELALLLLMTSAVQFIQKRHRRFSLAMAAGSLLYFIIAVKLIQPWALGDRPTTFGLSFLPFTKEPLQWCARFFYDPAHWQAVFPYDKLLGFFLLFASFAFLPLWGGWAMLILLPSFAILTISSNWLIYTLHPSFPTQYGISPSTAVAFAALAGLSNLSPSRIYRQRFFPCALWSISLAIILTVCHMKGFYRPLEFASFKQWAALNARDSRGQWIRSKLSEIPREAKVVASRLLKPQLADRRHLWEWSIDARTFFPDSLEQAEYFAVDVTYLQQFDYRGLLFLLDELKQERFGVLLYDQGLLIAQKGADAHANREAYNSIAPASGKPNTPSFDLTATIDPAWTVLNNCNRLDNWSPLPAIYLDKRFSSDAMGGICRKTASNGLDVNFWLDGDFGSPVLPQPPFSLLVAARSENWPLTHLESIGVRFGETYYEWIQPPGGYRVRQSLPDQWKLFELSSPDASTQNSNEQRHAFAMKVMNPKTERPSFFIITLGYIAVKPGN